MMIERFSRITSVLLIVLRIVLILIYVWLALLATIAVYNR